MSDNCCSPKSNREDAKNNNFINKSFSKKIRKEADILTGAVGLITKPLQAEKILQEDEADIIFMGRELLRNPYWPLYSMKELDGNSLPPNQYLRSI